MTKLDYSQNLQVIVNLALMEKANRMFKLASAFNVETMTGIEHNTSTDKLIRVKQALDLNKDHSEMISKAVFEAIEEAIANCRKL